MLDGLHHRKLPVQLVLRPELSGYHTTAQVVYMYTNTHTHTVYRHRDRLGGVHAGGGGVSERQLELH